MTFQLIQWAAICRLQSVQLSSDPHSIRGRRCFPAVLLVQVLFPFPVIIENISVYTELVLAAVSMWVQIQLLYHGTLNLYLED